MKQATSHLWKAIVCFGKEQYDLYEGCRVPRSIASKWRALVPFILVIPATRPATKIKKYTWIEVCIYIIMPLKYCTNIFYKWMCLHLSLNVCVANKHFWNNWDHPWAIFFDPLSSCTFKSSRNTRFSHVYLFIREVKVKNDMKYGSDWIYCTQVVVPPWCRGLLLQFILLTSFLTAMNSQRK